MTVNFHREYHKHRQVKYCNIYVNDKPFKEFHYNSVHSFERGLLESANKIMSTDLFPASEFTCKISVRFFDNHKRKIRLNFYGIQEILLFINGMQITLRV